jgi:hypothetical protein
LERGERNLKYEINSQEYHTKDVDSLFKDRECYPGQRSCLLNDFLEWEAERKTHDLVGGSSRENWTILFSK